MASPGTKNETGLRSVICWRSEQCLDLAPQPAALFLESLRYRQLPFALGDAGVNLAAKVFALLLKCVDAFELLCVITHGHLSES